MRRFLFLALIIQIFIGNAWPISTYAQTDIRQSKSVPEPQSNNPDELIQLGATYYRQQKLEEALAHFTKASRLSPQSFRPYVLIGLVYQTQDKMKSASESYAKAIQLRPNDKQLYLVKAIVDARRRAEAEALDACQKALELDPNYTEAFATIGETLRFNEKRRDDAISAYRSALKLNPRFLEAYEPLGELLTRNDDFKGAEALYQQAMVADPKKMTGRFPLGRMLVKQGRLAEARELWNGRTSEEDNTFPNFIVVLQRAENLQRATDALSQKPNDPAALVEMGFAVMDGDPWIVDGRQKRAITYFQQSLQINRKFARAQYGICKAYIQLSRPYENHEKDIVREMAKLRKLDSALAKELDEYRKNGDRPPSGRPVDFNR